MLGGPGEEDDGDGVTEDDEEEDGGWGQWQAGAGVPSDPPGGAYAEQGDGMEWQGEQGGTWVLRAVGGGDDGDFDV